MKHRIVLFQPYLRKHIVNFGKFLRDFEFIIKKPSSGNFYQSMLPPYEQEIKRVKINHINRLRRIFGILNVRIKFDNDADLFFTYGCMLLTNKPYCVYIENGVALYNYDTSIAANPIARWIFSFLIRQKNCKKLIFMSEAGQKSFFATVPYSKRTREIALEKSIQIYPLIESKNLSPKQSRGTLRLLFAGMFYMKGGIELVHAFARIREQYSNVELTIITPLHTVKGSDIDMMKGIPGLNLVEANLNAQAMDEMYQTHDIFMLPTFRDGFGLVLVEAISFAMPIICTDQYATTEVALDGYNAMVYPNHPLKDYDLDTYRLRGKYTHPRDFYSDLIALQENGGLRPVEDFLFTAIEKFLVDPTLLEKYSQNALALYEKKFRQDLVSQKLEAVFNEALRP